MTRDYWIGLATLPALAVVIAVILLLRVFVLYHIRRLKSAGTHRRVALAARIYSSRRGWVWYSKHFAVGVTVGHDLDEQDRAEAVLLDEFSPLPAPEEVRRG